MKLFNFLFRRRAAPIEGIPVYDHKLLQGHIPERLTGKYWLEPAYAEGYHFGTDRTRSNRYPAYSRPWALYERGKREAAEERASAQIPRVLYE